MTGIDRNPGTHSFGPQVLRGILLEYANQALSSSGQVGAIVPARYDFTWRGWGEKGSCGAGGLLQGGSCTYNLLSELRASMMNSV